MAVIAIRAFCPPILRKFWGIFAVYLKDSFAYPASTILWVLADAQAAIILPAVWVAAAGPGGHVAGFDRSGIVMYYLASMALAQFITSHLMWDIAWDIREGFFSSQLVRPIDYLVTQTARNMAWRVAKLFTFMPLYALVLLGYSRLVRVEGLHLDGRTLVAILLAQQLSFIVGFCLSMITLWTTEFESFLRSYYIPELVLSGRLLPLSAMPAWVLVFSGFLHFRYTSWFPTQMVLGRVNQGEANAGICIQIGWIVFFMILARLLYWRGSRQYSGVGM